MAMISLSLLSQPLAPAKAAPAGPGTAFAASQAGDLEAGAIAAPLPGPQKPTSSAGTGTAPTPSDPQAEAAPGQQPAVPTKPGSNGNGNGNGAGNNGNNGNGNNGTGNGAGGDADVTAMAGRVETIDLGLEPGARVRVVDHPEYGHVTVNPDNSLALVLTGETRSSDLSFSIEITRQNGRIETREIEVDVTPPAQADGWGAADYYMLETDAAGDLVVEAGQMHRKVYVSGSKDALSAADIAAREGIAVDKVTASFLKAHAEYGASAEMALDQDLGMKLWSAVTDKQTTSNWLLFEKGYSYAPGTMVRGGAQGESDLHPLLIGSWGEGADPVLTSKVSMIKKGGVNVVFQGVEFEGGFGVLAGRNVLLEDVRISGSVQANAQNVDGFTLRNSEILDVVRTEPVKDKWEPVSNRLSGIYVASSKGVLIEDVFADHTAWAEGYDFALSTGKGQPPSMYSHNFYLQSSNEDVTFRDNISMRPAGDGAQLRSGGFVEDNIFIDGNASLFVGPEANYSLVNGNVITSGAHKQTKVGTGALTQGLINSGFLTTLLDNIVAHSADPNNPAEIAAKKVSHPGLQNKQTPYHDDTIVFDWARRSDVNVAAPAGSNAAAKLNEATIQKFAALVTGKATATIADLAAHLRAEADGKITSDLDADAIIAYFRKAFGIVLPTTAGDSARFVPNELGEGVRWDNRLNWDTGVLPSDGQDIDLGNNRVTYGGTTRVGDLDLGSYGALTVRSGKLTVEGALQTEGTDASLVIGRAGQVWIDGHADGDLLNLKVGGGRFANTGDFEGSVRMEISGNAEAILATSGANFDLRAGSEITLVGGDVRVGFDGASRGTAVLRLEKDASLTFEAAGGKIGRIAEFKSGAFASDFAKLQSGVNLGSADLHLDVTGLKAGTYVLMQADEIIGTFGSFDVTGLNRNLNASVVIDYAADEVLLKIGRGTGALNLTTTGDEDDFAASNGRLWKALTDGVGLHAEEAPVATTSGWDLLP